MKTALSDADFRKRLKAHCIEERIPLFYFRSVFRNWFPFVGNVMYFDSDIGDEIYDAIYASLEDIGLIRIVDGKKVGPFVSPYDIVEMKAVEKGETGKYVGMTVCFKEFDIHRRKGRDDTWNDGSDSRRNVFKKVSLEMMRIGNADLSSDNPDVKRLAGMMLDFGDTILNEATKPVMIKDGISWTNADVEITDDKVIVRPNRSRPFSDE